MLTHSVIVMKGKGNYAATFNNWREEIILEYLVIIEVLLGWNIKKIC